MLTADVLTADDHIAWMLRYLRLAANAERDGCYRIRGRFYDRMAQRHYLRYLDKTGQTAETEQTER